MDVLPGHERVWHEFDEWARANHQNSQRRLTHESVAVLTGPSGVGKSHGVMNWIKSIGWDVIEMTPERCRKDVRDALSKATRSNMLQVLAGEFRPRVVLFDNVDVMVQSDRFFVNNLCEVLTCGLLPHIPVVLTCVYATEKRLASLKCRVFTFPVPSESDVLLFLRSHFPAMRSSELMTIAEKCNGKVGTALEDIRRQSKSSSRDVEADTQAMYRMCDAHAIRKALNDKPWINALKIHENLPHELERRRGTIINKRTAYRHFLETICQWETWMSGQDEDDILLPTELLTRQVLAIGESFPRKLADVNWMNNDEFTRVFSILSLQKKNAKFEYTKLHKIL